MEFQFLRAGLLTGLFVSLGVGPVTLLVVHRTLHKGRLFGVASGVGIVLADLIYAVISRTGLMLVEGFVHEHQFWLQLAISIIFIGLGIYLFFAHADTFHRYHVKKNYLRNMYTAFLVNLVNAVNILLFGILFAKFLPIGAHSEMSEILLIVGIIVGAMFWWTGLSYAMSHFKIKPKKIYILNRILGILVALMGIGGIIRIIL